MCTYTDSISLRVQYFLAEKILLPLIWFCKRRSQLLFGPRSFVSDSSRRRRSWREKIAQWNKLCQQKNSNYHDWTRRGQYNFQPIETSMTKWSQSVSVLLQHPVYTLNCDASKGVTLQLTHIWLDAGGRLRCSQGQHGIGIHFVFFLRCRIIIIFEQPSASFNFAPYKVEFNLSNDELCSHQKQTQIL